MKIFKAVLLISILLVFNFNIQAKTKITVAVAANVQFAMNDIKTEFEKATGTELEIILGSSGQLTAQIQQGAPYDVFISADTKYPDFLYEKGLTGGRPKIYAQGTLVLWTMKNDVDPNKKLSDIFNQDIKSIAVANPKTAPYGRAAMEVLKKTGLESKVSGKLVYGESISSVNQFIISGAADIGFTAMSVVLSPKMKGKGKWAEVKSDLYAPIMQSSVMLKEGVKTHPKEAKEFFNFLFSNTAKNIFLKYGYKVN